LTVACPIPRLAPVNSNVFCSLIFIPMVMLPTMGLNHRAEPRRAAQNSKPLPKILAAALKSGNRA
jgi:hypothetical protein